MTQEPRVRSADWLRATTHGATFQKIVEPWPGLTTKKYFEVKRPLIIEVDKKLTKETLVSNKKRCCVFNKYFIFPEIMKFKMK